MNVDAAVTLKIILKDYVCVVAEALFKIAGLVALLWFIIEAVKYITASNDPKARKEILNRFVHIVTGMILVLIAGAVVSTMVGLPLASICPNLV